MPPRSVGWGNFVSKLSIDYSTSVHNYLQKHIRIGGCVNFQLIERKEGLTYELAQGRIGIRLYSPSPSCAIMIRTVRAFQRDQ